MLVDLIQNFWLGFIITATPGAILAETLRRSLNARLHFVQFLVGNFIGMLLVILLAFAGVSVLRHSIANTIFLIISAAILLYIGASAALTNPRKANAQASTIEGSGVAALFTGATLAFANPLSFVFWISRIGSFGNDNTILVIVLDVLAVVFGALAVFIVIIILVKSLRTVITKRREQILSRTLGIIIIMYGVAVLYKAIA